MLINGIILFARYAFMPNKLGYCGGDDNSALFDYCVAKEADPGLVSILQEFQGAYPYLRLIAQSNNIPDPLDIRVVEAYWLGNELLNRVNLAKFYDSLRTRFAKRLDPKTLGYILGKVPLGARPYHSFHVFDVHHRVGMQPHNLTTMDKCRIGWGRIKGIEGAEFIVEHQPLILESGKLKLGKLDDKRVLHQVGGKGFITSPRVGDFVSFHWDWACDILTERQVQNLKRYTKYHLDMANLML